MKQAIILCIAILLSTASFAVSVCGITFADNAFADAIGAVSGTWSASGTTLQNILVGTTVGDSAYSASSAAYVTILFTDNLIQNRAGYDLVIFEESGTGSAGSVGCTMTLTINGITVTRAPVWASGTTYVSYIELSDFGVATNGTLSSFLIRGFDGGCPDYTAFGALNSLTTIPEPTGFLLLGLAIAFYSMKKK